MAERVEEAVAAEVEIANIAFEDDLSVDLEPERVPVARRDQLGDQVTVARQHLLQAFQAMSSMRDDPVGQVRTIINEDFGKLRHCYFRFIARSTIV